MKKGTFVLLASKLPSGDILDNFGLQRCEIRSEIQIIPGEKY
jgi:hypothetical protein